MASQDVLWSCVLSPTPRFEMGTSNYCNFTAVRVLKLPRSASVDLQPLER